MQDKCIFYLEYLLEHIQSGQLDYCDLTHFANQVIEQKWTSDASFHINDVKSILDLLDF